MLNLNKHTKTKPKPKPTLIFKYCLCLRAYHCAQLSYTIEHKTVMIIFPVILQTIIIAQMMSTGGEGGLPAVKKRTANTKGSHTAHQPNIHLAHKNRPVKH